MGRKIILWWWKDHWLIKFCAVNKVQNIAQQRYISSNISFNDHEVSTSAQTEVWHNNSCEVSCYQHASIQLSLNFIPEPTARSAVRRGLLIPHGYLHPGKCEHSEVQSSSMIAGASLWLMGGPHWSQKYGGLSGVEKAKIQKKYM